MAIRSQRVRTRPEVGPEAAVEVAPAVHGAHDRVELDRLKPEVALPAPAERLHHLLERKDHVHVAAPQARRQPRHRPPPPLAVEVELRVGLREAGVLGHDRPLVIAHGVDVAIVGAGHNGLVAAAYLARAGLSVTAFERRDIVGGACVTEELWPGVRASPGAYTLSLLRAEIVRDLDLERHGLLVEVHEPYLFAPFPDGRRVVTWSDSGRTHAQLERDWSRADADAYLDWARRRERAAAAARPLMLEPADRGRWLEAVGPELLDGAVADELAGIPRKRCACRSPSRA